MPTTTTTQPSRSAEARKARRIIREALRLSMAINDETQKEIHEAAQERLEAIDEDLTESLELMNELRQNREARLAKAEKSTSKSKAKPAADPTMGRKGRKSPAEKLVAEVVAAKSTKRTRVEKIAGMPIEVKKVA